MDGGSRGELESESFSADAMTSPSSDSTRIRAMRRDAWSTRSKSPPISSTACPTDRLSPETTDGYDGFVHPYVVQAGVERTSVKLLIRDFDTAGLAEKEALVAALAQEAASALPRRPVEVTVEESYRNMSEVLDQHPDVVAYACDAMRAAGLEVQRRARFAAAPTDRGCRSWDCRRRTSSPANTTFTRGSNGCRSRTWKRPSK